GLKGHADRDGNGRVTIDELYGYVHRNVTNTAEMRFPRPQTPVRIVRSGTPGVPVVIQLKPQTLKEVLADMAEQLAAVINVQKIPKVGVLEFTTDTQLGEVLGGNFGLLGRYCAVELERQLIEQGKGKFGVVNRRRLQAALKAQQFGLKDLGSPEALERLSKSAGGMPVIALGTLRNRAGRVVTLQCELIQTRDDELAGTAGGKALLNENEWAMTGRSVAVKPEDRRPETPEQGQPLRSVSAPVIEQWDERSQGAHPLSDPAFPFRVKIMVKDGTSERPTERSPVFRGNDMFVPLGKGEVYEIWVENRAGRLVLMRLLVDGLNTLPEKQKDKGVDVYQVAAGLLEKVPTHVNHEGVICDGYLEDRDEVRCHE
ncbi:hypothetical protein LCGC14_2968670, partial [marine sediment metagenome]